MKLNKKLSTVFLSLLLSACGTAVNIDYGDDFKSKKLSAYVIQAKPVKKPADPRFDNSFMEKRIISSITNTLNFKGYQLNKSKADFIVKYHVNIKQQVEGDDSGLYFGIGSFSHNTAIGLGFGGGTDVASYDEAILTIDFYDTTSNKLLWRGSLGKRLYDGATPESNKKLINELTTSILKEFPSK